MKDVFVLETAHMGQKEGGVIRVSPECYNKLLKTRYATHLPIGTIAERAIGFALERVKIVEEEGYHADAE